MNNSFNTIFSILFQSFLSYSSEKEKQQKISTISNNIFKHFKSKYSGGNNSFQVINACTVIAFRDQIAFEFKSVIEKTDLIPNEQKQQFFDTIVNHHYTDESELNTIIHSFWREHCEFKNFSIRNLTELFFNNALHYLK